MEVVLCDSHRDRCLLKTGVKDGPNKGKSFYVCSGTQGSPCGFIQQTEIPPSHCLHHDKSVVELQALVQQEHSYRLFFRCVLGKREGKRWCGSVPWKEVELEQRKPPLHGETQSPRIPRERNPFKAPSRTGHASEWRIIQEGGSIRGERELQSRKVEGERSAEDGEMERKSESEGMRRGKVNRKPEMEISREEGNREKAGGERKTSVEREQRQGEGRKEGNKVKERGGEQKIGAERVGVGGGGVVGGACAEGGGIAVSWRSRDLPPGMKVKQVSHEAEGHAGKWSSKTEPHSRKSSIEAERHSGKSCNEVEKNAGKSSSKAVRHAGKSSIEAERHTEKSVMEAERHTEKSVMEAERHAGKSVMEAERHRGKSRTEAEGHAAKSSGEAEGHAGKSSADAVRHAGKSSTEAERHTEQSAMEAERRTGKSSAEAERHAGKSSAEADRHAGKSSAEAERHAGKSSAEGERHAGKSSAEGERHAGKSVMEAERQSGKSSTEAEGHAGKNGTEAEGHAGKNGTEAVGHAGKNSTESEGHAGKNSTETEGHAGKSSAEAEGHAGKFRTEAPAHGLKGCDDGDDEVQLVSVQPVLVQRPLTSFPGFQRVSQTQGPPVDPHILHSQLSAQLKQKKATLSVVNVSVLPDGGERLRTQVAELEEVLESLSLTTVPSGRSSAGHGAQCESQDVARGKLGQALSQSNPFARSGGTILLPDPAPLQAPPSSSSVQLIQGSSLGSGVPPQGLYGGRMTESRLLAVKNATAETIDHLHRSLESCPAPDTEAPDPPGIKVSLLPHQKRALAWLLWRETQQPCGGILADDMGLGKTLTVIALILSQRKKRQEEAKSWISRADSTLVVSQATLVICPASLLHHWKREIERHVKRSRLSICLYHGPGRQRSAQLLAGHDVVVTTYSLVSKEIPALREDGEAACEENKASDLSPLLRVSWARLVLDEAHNIKNPKVQTSLAVCELRAGARWAVTGTPIQNNLLDMYSLLKFLRCSPFDEYKLWKAQVDNGSKRGGERLNILTRALLLRRTKDQLDSSGKPLVSLPDRSMEIHRVRLSEEEQSVYDVVFAQSRSTLQSYLKRHEGSASHAKGENSVNPFEKVAQEFGMSQCPAPGSAHPAQASSAVHILSLLLRLRQCCCHLSLLRKTLQREELTGDGIALSLEEQLSALSLCDASGPEPKDTVSLNGSRFPSELFQETRESTKISAVLSELKSIAQGNEAQKSVIVSQWTSMLKIVAVHLKRLGLRFATIDGSVNPKHRMELVEDFNTNPKGPQVMLVSLCAGGVGINLTGGNHLFLLDMHWNPALEDQACDRIYRVGQQRDVTIHRFVCEGTVEDQISSLQEKKKELASKVLSGDGNSVSKLSLADLRIIFGI